MRVRVAICAGVLALSVVSLCAAEPAPPVAARITIAEPGASQEVTVTGAAGAVPASSRVVVANLHTSHFAVADAAADGSFSATLVAPAGTALIVKADPAGHRVNALLAQMNQNYVQGNHFDLCPLGGTILSVPIPAASGPETRSVAAGTVHDSNGGPPLPLWIFDGTTDRTSLQPGEELKVQGRVRVLSPAVENGTNMRMHSALTLRRIAGADGQPVFATSDFVASLATPTGLPIERRPRHWDDDLSNGPGPVALTHVSSGVLEAEVSFRIQLPADLPHGWYQPTLGLGLGDVPREAPSTRAVMSITSHGREVPLSVVVRVGNPAPLRHFSLLLATTPSNGSLGAVALAQRDQLAMPQRVLGNSAVPVLPRNDERTGAPVAYRLEPFLPGISHGDKKVPLPPPVPFRLPSGTYSVTIVAPSGTSRRVGPAPIAQTMVSTPTTPGGLELTSGPLITDVTSLTTLDPAFALAFQEYGRHTIHTEGFVEDVWGNRWDLGGTYEIDVADLLTVDTATLPGTMFEVGDTVDLGATIVPPVPAEVETRITFAPRSRADLVTRQTAGARANRFGHVRTAGVTLSEPGEYRVDVIARHRGPDGSLRVGTRTWGGVVAPKNPAVIAHGRRGMEKQQSSPQAWFFRSQTEFPTVPDASHFFPPYHGGDVSWMQKSDSVFEAVTFHDPSGALNSLLGQRRLSRGGFDGIAFHPPGDFAQRASAGETPLFSSTPTGRDPHADPDSVDLWAYGYFSAQRPQVRVREVISEDQTSGHYWLFNGPYMRQRSVGAGGDLPNDFKLQFGAAVLHGAALAEPVYSIYASLFVLVPNDDPHGGSRTFPPFRGNGGGPDGGPLFTLKGEEIDLFFHPTGVRPGTILHRGQQISFAGYSAPTLPSKVEIVVTSPSGVERTVSGQANAIGYFHDPSQDFHAFESGVWKAKVRIVFDGRTSAGQLSEPFPSGGVLGSRDGEFYFYVVDAGAPQLGIGGVEAVASFHVSSSKNRHPERSEGPPRREPGLRGASAAARPAPAQDDSRGMGAATFLRPADGPITFEIEKPAGLTNATLTYTTTMPGFVLEEGTKTSLSYTYDAPRLAKSFPNLDLHDTDGLGGADTITMTLVLSGRDAGGAARHFARQIVIQGEELQMPDQSPAPKRRAVR